MTARIIAALFAAASLTVGVVLAVKTLRVGKRPERRGTDSSGTDEGEAER